MATSQITPEELQQSVLKWTVLAMMGFVGAVILYVYYAFLN